MCNNKGVNPEPPLISIDQINELKGTVLNDLLRFYGFKEGKHFNKKDEIYQRRALLAMQIGVRLELLLNLRRVSIWEDDGPVPASPPSSVQSSSSSHIIPTNCIPRNQASKPTTSIGLVVSSSRE